MSNAKKGSKDSIHSNRIWNEVVNIKSILKVSVVYLVLDGLQRGFLLLLTPVFTHYMSPEELGQISLGSTLISIMTVILGSSLGASITRYYGKLQNNRIRLRAFLGTLYGLALSVSLFAMAILIVLPESVYQWLIPGLSFKNHVLPIGMAAITNSVLLVIVSNLKAAQNAKTYTVYGILSILGQGGLIYLLVVRHELGSTGYFWAQAVLNISLLLGAIIISLNQISMRFSKKYFGLILRYSLPIIPIDLIGFVNAYVDRILIAQFLGLYQAGLYHVAIQFSLVIYMVLIAVNSAITPHFFRAFDRLQDSAHRGKENLEHLFTLLVYGSAILVASVILLSPEALRLFFPAEYKNAQAAVPLLCFNYGILAVYFFSTNALSTKPSLASYRFRGILLAGLTNLLMGYWLIPQLGLLGASVATSAGQVAMAGYFTRTASKKTKARFPNRWGFILLATTTALATLINLGSEAILPSWGSLVLKLMLIGIATVWFQVVKLRNAL